MVSASGNVHRATVHCNFEINVNKSLYLTMYVLCTSDTRHKVLHRAACSWSVQWSCQRKGLRSSSFSLYGSAPITGTRERRLYKPAVHCKQPLDSWITQWALIYRHIQHSHSVQWFKIIQSIGYQLIWLIIYKKHIAMAPHSGYKTFTSPAVNCGNDIFTFMLYCS